MEATASPKKSHLNRKSKLKQSKIRTFTTIKLFRFHEPQHSLRFQEPSNAMFLEALKHQSYFVHLKKKREKKYQYRKFNLSENQIVFPDNEE